jgi:hypothetical protein
MLPQALPLQPLNWLTVKLAKKQTAIPRLTKADAMSYTPGDSFEMGIAIEEPA